MTHVYEQYVLLPIAFYNKYKKFLDGDLIELDKKMANIIINDSMSEEIKLEEYEKVLNNNDKFKNSFISNCFKNSKNSSTSEGNLVYNQNSNDILGKNDVGAVSHEGAVNPIQSLSAVGHEGAVNPNQSLSAVGHEGAVNPNNSISTIGHERAVNPNQSVHSSDDKVNKDSLAETSSILDSSRELKKQKLLRKIKKDKNKFIDEASVEEEPVKEKEVKLSASGRPIRNKSKFPNWKAFP